MISLSEAVSRQSRDKAMRERVLASLVNAIGQQVDATRSREARAAKERVRYKEVMDGVERAHKECSERAAEWRQRSGSAQQSRQQQQQRQREKQGEEEKTAMGDTVHSEAADSVTSFILVDDVALYCDVQDSWRRYNAAARLLRDWLKPQQLAGDNEHFAAMLDADMRPSSAASSIVSQLSSSSRSDEALISSRSNASARSASSGKAASRASSLGMVQVAGASDVLVVDARRT